MNFRLGPSLLAIFMGFIIGVCSGYYSNHDAAEGLAVKVDGNFGAPVAVQVEGRITRAEQHITVNKGTGREIVENSAVLVRVSNFAYSGGYIMPLEDATLKATAATEKDLGDLYSLLLGATEGSRLIGVYPHESKANAEIIVLDVLPTVILGEPLPIAGMPAGISVNSDDSGIPSVSADGAKIAQESVAVVIRGEGEQVKQDAVVYANYIITNTSGEVLESTFGVAPIPSIDPQQVFSGLAQAIRDQRVGSRIVAAIPATQARGDGDVIVVIDILAVRDGKSLNSQR